MLESLRKNKKGILLMLFAAACLCLAQYLWKIMFIQTSGSPIIYLILGFAIAGTGGLTMIYAYRFGELSVIHPMNSMSYVYSAILSVIALNEEMTIQKILGIAIIMIGVILIGGSNEK